MALKEADLSKGMALKECTHAAFAVLHALQTELSPGEYCFITSVVNMCSERLEKELEYS